MSDIRFNQWLHQSGTGGVSQVASGAVGVGTTNPLADFYVRGDAQITGILTAGHIAMGSSITFGDDDRIYLGDGTDFQLYHASSDNNSYIVESGAGSLVVNASKLHVKNAANNEDVAVFNQSGNNELYFSNAKKFETTNTGAVVTGILTATSFKGDGSALTGISAGPGTGESYVKLKNSSGTLNNGGENVYAGYRAGASLASGANENTFYGTDAGRDCATGDYNVFIGHRAGENSLNSKNTAIGAESLHSQTSGQSNTAVGYQAGIKITTANSNTAVGYMTLSGDGSSHNVTGGSNVVMGYMSGYGISSGERNVLIGYEAGYDMTTGNWNSGLGFQALENVGVGTCNTACGYEAGYTINTGNNNTCLGFQATTTASDTSNEVTIGNSAVTRFRVPGIGLDLTSAPPTLTNGSNNRVVTATGASGLNGEASLTFDGTNMLVNGTMLNAVQLKFGNSGTAYIDHNIVGQDIQFRVGNSSALDKTAIHIDSTGNIGIGLNNPGAQLHLAGPSEIRFNNATDAGNFAKIKCFEESSNNHAILAFSVGSGEALRIANDGNIGVNCTSPTSISGHRGITLKGTNANAGFINFMDSADNSDGRILATDGELHIHSDPSDNTGGSEIVFFVDTSRKASIRSSGDVHIADGNLVLASGHGIDFSATGNGPANQDELFSDYEKGTWTPALSSGTCNPADAYYVRTGDLVFVTCSIDQISERSSSNNVRITSASLPFAIDGNTQAMGPCRHRYTSNHGGYQLTMVMDGNGIYFTSNDSAQGDDAFSSLNYSDINATYSMIAFGGWYKTNA